MSEPVNTGAPISVPACVASQLKTPPSMRNVTSTPLSIHPAKHTVNAMVLRVRVELARFFPFEAIPDSN